MRGHAAAVSNFPLGRRMGELYYGVFAIEIPLHSIVAIGIGLAVLASLITTFAGVVANPLQVALGIHQRRLARLLDKLEGEGTAALRARLSKARREAGLEGIYWPSAASRTMRPPSITRQARLFRHRGWRGLCWHVDETYVRVNGRWCYLWRAVDQRGQLVDLRPTARRNLSAAWAFLRHARDNARLCQLLSITIDRARTYAKVIAETNRGRGADNAIEQITRRRHNNIIESDHAALKRLTTPMRGLQSPSTAKATLNGIEAIRTIKKHHNRSGRSGREQVPRQPLPAAA